MKSDIWDVSHISGINVIQSAFCNWVWIRLTTLATAFGSILCEKHFSLIKETPARAHSCWKLLSWSTWFDKLLLINIFTKSSCPAVRSEKWSIICLTSSCVAYLQKIDSPSTIFPEWLSYIFFHSVYSGCEFRCFKTLALSPSLNFCVLPQMTQRPSIFSEGFSSKLVWPWKKGK